MSSVSRTPLTDSARALAKLSPRETTERTAPSSARRSVYRIAACTPRSLWWTSPARSSERRLRLAISSASMASSGAQGARHSPAHDPAAEGVDDEGDEAEAGPGRDVGDVGEPEAVWGGRAEGALHEIGR